MKERTIAIITILKGNTKYKEGDGIECIKSYMNEVTGVPKGFYTPAEIEKLLRETFYDFLDTCDKPSYYLREADRLMAFPNDYSYSHAVCGVLVTTQVCKNSETLSEKKYVNGFDESFMTITKKLQ